jgi:hypothetical protein
MLLLFSPDVIGEIVYRGEDRPGFSGIAENNRDESHRVSI